MNKNNKLKLYTVTLITDRTFEVEAFTFKGAVYVIKKIERVEEDKIMSIYLEGYVDE